MGSTLNDDNDRLRNNKLCHRHVDDRDIVTVMKMPVLLYNNFFAKVSMRCSICDMTDFKFSSRAVANYFRIILRDIHEQECEFKSRSSQHFSVDFGSVRLSRKIFVVNCLPCL